jgi:phosphoribosylformylglycinamidine synthase
LGIPAIGGKDSMSGTFKDISVPPTLVAFALAAGDARKVISPEFKQPGSRVVFIPMVRDEYELPDFDAVKAVFSRIHELVSAGSVLAAQTVRAGGIAAAVSKMAFGNQIGFQFARQLAAKKLFAPDHGSFILEIPAETDIREAFDGFDYELLGHTDARPVIVVNGEELPLTEALDAWERPLERIFPTRTETVGEPPVYTPFTGRERRRTGMHIAQPRVFIPVFPGTNCEYDSVRAFEKAGGRPHSLVVRNLTPQVVEQSIQAIAAAIDSAQIVMLPGGFSAGDEPDGSGKFIAAMFRNPRIKEAVHRLLNDRDGLMLGICNGFQALIKLGLVPYGKIVDLNEDSPTLTYNKIGRHISRMARTVISSNVSPWFTHVSVGDIHTVALSHGEGRFVASPEVIKELRANGQIATQYVDLAGRPSNDIRYNGNGSMEAIEGITSPDGRVLGKMGHSERTGNDVVKNIPGEKDQQIFAAGIEYFL